MSYLVLARKWRPRRFEEMVGQEHVLRALINALESGRVHHAFLFTGTRGVGKTTVARILAKALNCEQGVGPTPCGECAACREIDEGRFVDLIEVDAASRTKVDDTRELLENVQYLPTRGRYKVYLVDEVHMLSGHSFNALLKTLEEPPPHVKFLLATTDPQKVPVTVLSRCLQFNLKKLPPALIAERLRMILDAEGVPFEPGAVSLLARAADGSLRDALSLLDQLLAYGGGRAVESDARTMLGTIGRGHVEQILRLLAQGDAPGLMACVASLDEHGPDYARALDELAALLQQVALHQAVPDLKDDGGGGASEFATSLAAEDVQLYYQMAILGRRDLPLAPEPRSGFEMVLLRMLAFRPEAPGGGAVATGRQGRPTPAATPAPASRSAGTGVADWRATIERLALKGAVRELALHCSLVADEGDRLRVRLDARGQGVRTRQLEDRLAQALSSLLGRDVGLDFEVSGEPLATPAREREREEQERMEQAQLALGKDPTVQALKDRLGAVVQEGTVKPVD